MRAAGVRWRVAVSVAMIPVMATLEAAFGRPFWVGAVGGAVSGGAFWLSWWLRRRGRAPAGKDE